MAATQEGQLDRIERKVDRICDSLYGDGGRNGLLTRIKVVEVQSGAHRNRVGRFVELLIAASLAAGGALLVAHLT